MLAILFGLIRMIILVLKGIVEFAFVGQICICPLVGDSSICEYNFPLNGSLSYFLMHNLQKSAVTEFQSQRGPRRSRRLRVQAAHKQGQDGHIWPLRFIYTAGAQKHQFHHACCAKHPADPRPQGRVKGAIRSAGFYTPGLLMGGPGDTECYILEESALVPSESAHLLALCLNFQPLKSLLWLRAVVPYHFLPLQHKELFLTSKRFTDFPHNHYIFSC